jgi:polysaccharide biosynthesis/export protein
MNIFMARESNRDNICKTLKFLLALGLICFLPASPAVAQMAFKQVAKPGDSVVSVPSEAGCCNHVLKVGGAVLKPGEYPLRQGMTLTAAIGKVGGFANNADISKVKLIRAEQETVYDLRVIKPDGSNNPVLLDGDEILVPEATGTNQLFRGLLRPGDSVLLIINGSGDLSITTTYGVSERGIVKLPQLEEIEASGLTVEALIQRINAAYQTAGLAGVSVSAPKPEEPKGIFKLRKGPGKAEEFPLRAGMTLLAAINRAGGMDGKVRQIKILRGGKELIFDVRKILPDGSNNPMLMDGDEILIQASSEKPDGAALLNPGDTVLIKLKEPASDSHKITTVYSVSNQGTIKLPLLKQEIPAWGLSEAALARSLEIAYIKLGIFKFPIIQVTLPPLAKISEKSVAVAGEVQSAGEFAWTKGMTLREAIQRAGGITELAAFHRVKIVRNGKELVYDLREIKPDNSNNPVLMDGDQIIVPTD